MPGSIYIASQLQCRVSSVLNRDAKQFGKNHLFDNKEDTCWTSDQGSPQWIIVSFKEDEEVSGFMMQFQGGFVGKDCHVEVQTTSNSSFIEVEPFYPEDVNSLQTFILKNPVRSKVLKFVFNNSTDFYGRIVMYKLEIMK